MNQIRVSYKGNYRAWRKLMVKGRKRENERVVGIQGRNREKKSIKKWSTN